jgi:hypothetical protein
MSVFAEIGRPPISDVPDEFESGICLIDDDFQ